MDDTLLTDTNDNDQARLDICNNPTDNPWRTPKNVWYTIGLFYELCGADKSKCLYTIYEVDRVVNKKKYISLKSRYLEMEHIPGYEYDFANKYLGGWSHWVRLQSATKALSDIIQEWKDELEIKLKARSARAIINTSLDESPTAFHANKWISDKGWLPQKGRPKKADITREAKIAAGVEAEISDDLERIRLVK